MTSYAQFVARVRERTGLDELAAARAVRATLETVGEALLELETTAIGDALPAALAAMLRARARPGELDAAELYARVSEREGVEPGFAMEHAQVVCRVLAESIPDALHQRLLRDLPEPLQSLLTIPAPSRPPEERLHHSPSSLPPRRTLADGRPGSEHPVSEAAPERAHSESVVRAKVPHEATKLSTSRGPSPSRSGETLAGGAPGSARPLGDAKK